MLQTPQYQYYDIISSMNLKEFIESETDMMMDNAQTRMLSGQGNRLAFGACTEADLEKAKTNLNQYFTVVGLTEKFDETLMLLKRAFDWKKPFYTRRNVTTNRPGQNDLLPATPNVIVKNNQLDMALYQYATDLFQQQVREQGSSFSREVKLFQLTNRLFNPLKKAYLEIRKRSLRTFVRNQVGAPS
jgi:hypothetical protein